LVWLYFYISEMKLHIRAVYVVRIITSPHYKRYRSQHWRAVTSRVVMTTDLIAAAAVRPINYVTRMVNLNMQDGHLIASCVKNIRTKNYQNVIIVFQVTVENVGDVFGTQCTCNLL